MPINCKQAMLTGASVAFIAFSSAFLSSAPAAAGPLAITPKANLALPSLLEQVQYRRGVRQGRVQQARRYSGGRRYVNNRRGVGPFLPAAVLGVFAGAFGAAAYGGSYYCDPAYYSWNYNGACRGAYRRTYYPAYSGGYYPAYSGEYYSGGEYYPAYSGGYYPAYRSRPVIYRTNVQRPRAVRYRAVAPSRHFVGSRTHLRQGYTVRRVRR